MDIKTPFEKAAEETAKAAQEIAKVAGKSVDVANSIGGFFTTIFGAGFSQLGSAFSDWAATFRYQQALKLADKVKKIHEDRHLEGRTITIPPRLGIPLLQNATLEDDDNILNMWAGLIANATDPGANVQAQRTFGVLLSSFEPLDAIVLLEIERWKREFPERRSLNFSVWNSDANREHWPNLRKISASIKVRSEDVALSLENLHRLGLVQDHVIFDKDLSDDENSTSSQEALGSPVPITHEYAMIDLTYSGRALLHACKA